MQWWKDSVQEARQRKPGDRASLLEEHEQPGFNGARLPSMAGGAVKEAAQAYKDQGCTPFTSCVLEGLPRSGDAVAAAKFRQLLGDTESCAMHTPLDYLHMVSTAAAAPRLDGSITL